MNKIVASAILIGLAISNINAQNILSKKERQLKPQTSKNFDYITVDGSSTAISKSFMYNSVGPLAKTFEQEAPANILLNPQTNLPIYIELPNPVKKGLGVYNEEGMVQAILDNLSVYSKWMQIENFKKEFLFVEKLDDPMGFDHFKLQQFYKGVKVYGGQLILHETNKLFDYVNGTFYPTPKGLSVVPSVSSIVAMNKVIKDVKKHSHYYEMSDYQKELLAYTKPEEELVVYHANNDFNLPKLAYHFTIRPNFMERFEYFIDAHSGEILHHYDHTCSIDGPKTGTGTDLNNKTRTVNSYQVGSKYYLINTTKSMYNSSSSNMPSSPKGCIWTIDAQNSDGSSLFHVSSSSASNWVDKSAVSAHHNGGVAFDYFKNTHGRNAINGVGGTIGSVVNVTKDGKAMDNAYWNGVYMFYGNGATSFHPLAGSLDVAGHEMTHGVVQNTAGLIYNGQSGAINESMADIFGAMMDRDDWKIGEDIIKSSQFLNGALRDMSNPHQGRTQLFTRGYQPAKMDEYYTGTQDNSGVHINSGIVNHAFYKFATAVGKDKAEKVYFRTLSLYLTKSSQFLDLRFAVVKAAGDLYGKAEVDAVKAAFDFVQIYDPNSGGGGGGTGDEDDLEQHPGTAKMLWYNKSGSTTIYRGTNTGGSRESLSTTTPKSKISVTDDGSAAYYVASDKTIKSINLSTKTESTAQNEAIWSNVAVSPDGSKIAAVTEEDDTAIWVYDFAGAKWYKFTLYNPTFSGVKAGGVDYADAIEWNYSSEYILYDAKNTIGGNSYFDIGFIQVWNNETNKVSDGTIKKAFTSLPDGVSVGNATFSKNSPYIIAMDYISSSTALLKGLNLNSGAQGTIFTNSVLNFPNYSLDDKKIGFNYKQSGSDIIGVIDLATSKITNAGAQGKVLVSASSEKGVFFGVGERDLLSDKKEMLSFGFLNLSPAVKGTISGNSINLTVPSETNLSSMSPTFTYSPKAKVHVGGKEQTSGVSLQNFSSTVQYTVKAEDNTTKTYNVTVTKAATNIEDVDLKFSVYPIPALNQITIDYPGVFEYELVSILGKKLVEGNAVNSENVSVSDFPNGTYLVKLLSKDGSTTIRFIKE